MSGDHDRVVYVWGASAQGGLGPGCICQRIYDRGLICGGLLSFMCGAFCYIWYGASVRGTYVSCQYRNHSICCKTPKISLYGAFL